MPNVYEWSPAVQIAVHPAVLQTLGSPSSEAAALIDQSMDLPNFYGANIPGIARLSGATAKSVFKSTIIDKTVL